MMKKSPLTLSLFLMAGAVIFAQEADVAPFSGTSGNTESTNALFDPR